MNFLECALSGEVCSKNIKRVVGCKELEMCLNKLHYNKFCCSLSRYFLCIAKLVGNCEKNAVFALPKINSIA